MDHQLSLAGVGTSQVLGGAGVHTGVFGASIENDQRIFRVIVDEGEVAALLEEDIVLQTAITLKWVVIYRLVLQAQLSPKEIPYTTEYPGQASLQPQQPTGTSRPHTHPHLP